MSCSFGFCRQYSCCCLIPSVSWGAQLVAWFHLVVCAFVLVAFASSLDAVSVAIIGAEILMHLTLLYGVIRRRRVAVAVWVSFSLVAGLVTVTTVTKSIAETVRALDAEYPDDDKAKKVATGKIIAVSILAAGAFMLELYYVLVVWSFYVELKEEADAMLLPMHTLDAQGSKAVNDIVNNVNENVNDQDGEKEDNVSAVQHETNRDKQNQC